MPIDDEDFESESISGDRQLELFTDRHEFTRRFAFYLNEDPPREQILYFYGDGGNGKSLLLKHLQVNCCKRFSPQVWQQLRALPEERAAEVADFVREAKTYTPIPVVRHDFGLIPIKEDKPQDRFYGLLMLRRNLAEAEAAKKYKFKFPNYDFACCWYLLNKGESNATLNQLLPDDVIQLVTPAIETWAQFPVVAQTVAVIKGIIKLSGIKGMMKLIQKRLGVSDEKAKEIRSKDIDTELIDCLPTLFARDLNAAMAGKNKPERLVMLFDTHEKLWDEKRSFQGIKFWYQDEWFRRLLLALKFKLGIVVVVAGRDCPVTQLRWPNALGDMKIPEHLIDAQLVGHLSATDARDYLHKVEIDKADLADAVIRYASVNPDDSWENLQIHPFYLGLCADVVLAERRRGIELLSSDFARIPKLENKTAELTDRLLSYVDREVRSAVHSLSAGRAFDEDLYIKLGAGCHFQASSANFEILTSFSFVWKEPQRGEKWYRIHDLLRRLDADRDNDKTRRAHEVLEGYYRELGNAAEAIFHANRLDWERGVDEWEEVFEEASRLSRYGECESLLAVRSELWIKSDFWLGRISNSEGDYYAHLARYAEAKQEYLEAVAAYDCELILTPDDEGTLNNKGNALRCLGDLQAQLTEFEDAKQSYSEAIAAFDSALVIAPDYITALGNKGIGLQRLGELQALLTERDRAELSYLEAIVAYNSALVIAPKDSRWLNNKGNALQGLGELQALIKKFDLAKLSYKEAIAAYGSALQIAPDDIGVLNKGNALQRLGELQALLSEFPDAKLSYKEAIAAYDSALQIAPDDSRWLSNKGGVLVQLGQLQVEVKEFDAAKQSYSEAIATCKSALLIAPDYNYALNNKGNALRCRGDLQAQLSESEFEAAKLSYKEAIASFDSALVIAPDYILALNSKGLALKSMGDLQAKLFNQQEALKNWQEALEMYNRSLAIAPNDDWARNRREALQESLDYLGNDTVSS
ncbi:hypothetical protein [Microcoleus sp. Pol10D4]|uniref:hypothetical protein n=1 Tax=Microcoleus sp. Pol10D4 TaxID=3055387 RepID=UPI002FCEA061